MNSPFNNRLFLVLDVESLGLHGPSFAAGAVIVDRVGSELDKFYGAYNPSSLISQCSKEDMDFVTENVLPNISFTHEEPYQFYNSFWNFWMRWKNQGATMWADCCWPVETNFLSCVIGNSFSNRKWNGPYPLMDLAPLLFSVHRNPVSNFPRLENELPIHNPLADARQSARVLLEVLDDI